MAASHADRVVVLGSQFLAASRPSSLSSWKEGPFGVEARRGGERVEFLTTQNPVHQDALAVPARQLPDTIFQAVEIDGEPQTFVAQTNS